MLSFLWKFLLWWVAVAHWWLAGHVPIGSLPIAEGLYIQVYIWTGFFLAAIAVGSVVAGIRKLIQMRS
jgi:hypothetical protein